MEKSRVPEFYGFVVWASTSFLFILYILWALLPDSWIMAFGINWYPNRWALPYTVNHELKTVCREWSILIPAWSIVVIILTYIVYWSLALMGTPRFSDLSTVTGRKVLSTTVQTSNIVLASDSFAQFPPSGQHPNPYLTSTHPSAIPQLYDIPIGMVNRVLYHHKMDKHQWYYNSTASLWWNNSVFNISNHARRHLNYGIEIVREWLLDSGCKGSCAIRFVLIT